MPLPTVPDHYYAAATFQNADGDIAVNTFTFRNDSPTTSGEAAASALRDLLDEFYGDRSQTSDTVGFILSPRLHALTYVIYDLGDPEGGGWELPSLTWPADAGSSTGIAPPDLAVCMSWQTAKRGRSFRGRTYIGPLSSLVVGNTGRPSSTVLTTLAAAGARLIGDPLTRSFSLGVLSRVKGLVTPVTGGYVDDAFDVQRRRDPGPTERTPIVAP